MENFKLATLYPFLKKVCFNKKGYLESIQHSILYNFTHSLYLQVYSFNSQWSKHIMKATIIIIIILKKYKFLSMKITLSNLYNTYNNLSPNKTLFKLYHFWKNTIN